MLSEPCGPCSILALSEDVLSIVSVSLSLTDICNLSVCCRSLYDLSNSDKVWLIQCHTIGVVPFNDLIEWRKWASSYKALCRFLTSVHPLFGIWVHQNPELGNVVYVMPGFVSVIGCRIIPQELGPLGIEGGPILWAPVFEIICKSDGSTAFFLHGREDENDYLYPGSLKPVDKMCNVLLLEVDSRKHANAVRSVHTRSSFHKLDKEISRKICRSDCGLSRSKRVGQSLPVATFGRLSFGDRRKLLDIVTDVVRLKGPESSIWPLFPRFRNGVASFKRDYELLSERRLLLMQMYKVGPAQSGDSSRQANEQFFHPTRIQSSEIRKKFDQPSGSNNRDDKPAQCSKRKTFGGYFRNGFRLILRKSNAINNGHASLRIGSSSHESRQAKFQEFLSSGDTIGLTLHASTLKLTSYRAWPNMHDSRFALYKLPMHAPSIRREFTGLWGGTFGWPPGIYSRDKPGKALFCLLLSYEESDGRNFLIATKILEGTHYVLHPNGSAMFTVNIDEPSLDPFPWDADGDSVRVDVKHAFLGDGIANGYGFRYPGSKPGSLYVIQDGLLVFIWKESKAVLTLERLHLQELLKKGERVPALPPIANFSYLTKSYSNVFTGFSNPSSGMSSPR